MRNKILIASHQLIYRNFLCAYPLVEIDYLSHRIFISSFVKEIAHCHFIDGCIQLKEEVEKEAVAISIDIAKEISPYLEKKDLEINRNINLSFSNVNINLPLIITNELI